MQTGLQGRAAAPASAAGHYVTALTSRNYDSSIFPIRHDRYGIPDAAAEPGTVRAPSGRRLVEFPMTPASFLGMKVPVCGGGYFRIFPYWLSRAGLRQINARGQPFPFYLHPWEIDPGQPRIRVGLVSRFRHCTHLDRCEARLRRLLAEFRFAPMIDALRARELLPNGGSSALRSYVSPHPASLGA